MKPRREFPCLTSRAVLLSYVLAKIQDRGDVRELRRNACVCRRGAQKTAQLFKSVSVNPEKRTQRARDCE